jgi:tetratricopeptide (TPR) repeat protein
MLRTLLLLALATGAAIPSARAQVDVHTAAAVRTALAAQRTGIAAKPADVPLRVGLCNILMDAGLGEEAWDEARRTTADNPQSSLAFSNYGWMLHHNAIGVNYGFGYRYDDSLAAFRKAIQLAPNDLQLHQSLADNLRYDRQGVEYTLASELPRSIEELQYVQAHQKPVASDVSNNLAIALFYAGRYQDALNEAHDSHPATPVLDAVLLATLAITRSPEVAVQTAQQLATNTQRRNAALTAAAKALLSRGLYPQAVVLLTAAQREDQPNPAALRMIQILRTLRPYEPAAPNSDDPRAPVLSLLAGAFLGTLDRVDYEALLVPEANATPEEREENESELHKIQGVRNTVANQIGMPPRVMVDVLMASLKLHSQPIGDGGLARVDGFLMGGSAALHVLLLKQDKSYRIVALNTTIPAGAVALSLLQQGRLAQAAAILDWEREFTPALTEDDPIGGSLFARLWSPGQTPTQSSVELAAAALTTHSASTAALLPELVTLSKHAEGKRKDAIRRLLAEILLSQANGKAAEAEVGPLLKDYPISPTAVRLAGRADALTHNWSAWKAMLTSLIAQQPSELEWLREQAIEQATEGDYATAHRTYLSLLETGRAKPADNNETAWLSLFDPHMDPAARAAARDQAQQAAAVPKPTWHTLQTLACVQATLGDAAEARQTLLRAMIAANLDEPNEAIWLGYGILYQQYGEKAAATRAFLRIAKPSGEPSATSVYVLAQIHLNQLK